MNIRFKYRYGFSLALFMVASTIVNAAQFSMNVETRTQGSIPSVSGSSIFSVQGVKQREEWKDATGKTVMINIRRPDKGVVWYLIPGRKLCQECPIPKQKKAISVTKELNQQMRAFKRVGSDNIKGYRCDRYECIQVQGQMTIIWISKKLNTVLKREWLYPKGSQIKEVKSIKEKAQPDSLFEIPSGYKKLILDSNGKAVPNW